MAYKSFFGEEESEYFDLLGRPKRPGIYEFQRFDGRKIIYTLDLLEQENEEASESMVGQGSVVPPRLKVVRASSLEDYPNPAHALKNLDGQWVRFLGDQRQE
jgi:hypothetical protein